MQMEYRDCVINLLDTPGPPGLLRRHLPRADRGRRGADGDRRGQRRRAADAAPAAGLPRAQHADPDLRQQDGPRGQGAAGADGRDRARARHGGRALHLAGRHGQELPRRDGPAREADARRSRPARTATADDDDEILDGLDNPRLRRALRHAVRAGRGRDRAARATPRRAFDRSRLPRRPADADVLRLGGQQLRRARGARRAGRPGAAAGRPSRRCSAWCSPTSRSSAAWCSRSRPTWTRRTATGSPSCASPRATSSAACA